MENKAVVVYSFGGSFMYGPGKANIALARVAAQKANEIKALLVVQDYIEKALSFIHRDPDHTVNYFRDACEFISTEDATKHFATYLRSKGITTVFLVAFPLIYWKSCKELLVDEGFKVLIVPTSSIPFDRHSDFVWTRSLLHFLLLAFLQKITGR